MTACRRGLWDELQCWAHLCMGSRAVCPLLSPRTGRTFVREHAGARPCLTFRRARWGAFVFVEWGIHGEADDVESLARCAVLDTPPAFRSFDFARGAAS